MTAHRSSPLRLLTVSNMWPSDANPVYGGFVARNVEALREEGAHVTVIANEDFRTGSLHGSVKYVRLMGRVLRHARRERFDAVIGHYLYPTAAIARLAVRHAGTKLVLVVHGTDSRSAQRKGPLAFAVRRALHAADLVVTVSQALGRVVRDDLALPDRVPVAVVHMGIDDRVFRPDPSAREFLGIGGADRIVLFVGNLVELKGLDILQTAFRKMIETGAADRLVIVGDGPMGAELRAWASGQPDLAGRVLLTGRIEQAEVARWMAAADVLVLPSRNEGLGLVLLEAMACGTPCVASRVGGVAEIVDDSTGLLVPPEDVGALALALAQVLEKGREAYRQACIDAAAGHSARKKAGQMIAAIRAID